MANDFYQHSGHPGTRAPRSSALLRAEFAAIEDGFDKLPDVGTANLFSVSDGSALVGKTAAQAKVILALEKVTNTADADKPISTLAQAALNLKAPLASPVFTGDPRAVTRDVIDDDTSIATTAFVKAALVYPFTSSLSQTGWVVIPLSDAGNNLLIQWGLVTTHATAGTPATHNFPIAFDAALTVVGIAFAVATVAVTFASMTNTGFNTYSSASSQTARYIAIGRVAK